MKLNADQKQRVLSALQTLAQDGPTGICYGICWNLDDVIVQGQKFVDTYELVSTLSVDWPGRTGPVGNEGTEYAKSCYPIRRSGGSLWRGEQLEQRQSLLAYLMQRVEEMPC